MITNEYYRHVRMNNAPVNVCNGINNIERRSSEYILNDDRRVKIDEIGKKKKKLDISRMVQLIHESRNDILGHPQMLC